MERIFESLFVEVSLSNNKKIVIGSIYRPGKTPGLTFTEQFTQFSDILLNILAELGNNYEQVFLYGDFNLNILDLAGNKFISEYVDTIFSHGYLQFITKPTRICENTATLLDHVLTNSTAHTHNLFILCSKLSDHFPIVHQIDFSKIKNKIEPHKSRNFSPESIQRFKDALSNYNWNHVTDQNCVQEAANNFLSTFDTLFNAFFPETTKKFNKAINPIEPWMSQGVRMNLINRNF